MKKTTTSIIAAIFLVAISLAGYANQDIPIQTGTVNANNSEIMQAFEVLYRVVIKKLQTDSSYKRFPLKGEKELKWFNTIAFKLWDKQISKDQFISEGLKRFPGYKESFEYLAKEFKK